jgi:hypothetical protein
LAALGRQASSVNNLDLLCAKVVEIGRETEI